MCLEFIERFIDELELMKVNIEMITKDSNVNFLFMNVDRLNKIKQIILEVRNGDSLIYRKAKIQAKSECSMSLTNLSDKSVFVKETPNNGGLYIIIEAFVILRFMMFTLPDTHFYNIVYLEKGFMDRIIKRIVEIISKIDLKINFIKREAVIRVKEREISALETSLKEMEISFEKKEIGYRRRIFELTRDLENALGKRLRDNEDSSVEELPDG